MIPEIIKQWDENKNRLELMFAQTPQLDYNTYKKIVEAIFTFVIDGYDLSKIHVIDDGDYQGTQIFLIPKDTYQPSATEYLVTNTYYGSCSGCDTLEGIACYNDGIPTDDQVKDYMTLALHLVQRMKYLFDENDYM